MDWNALALDGVVAAKMNAPMTARVMALVHTAMFDSVNAIERRFSPYRVTVSDGAGALSGPAAAASAHAILVKLLPDQMQAFDTAYAGTLAQYPDGDEKSAGVRIGQTVAERVIAWRGADGVGAPNTYRPRTAPGVYVPTSALIGWDFANSVPWLMDSPAQFRPGPPPPLASDTWARDYDEVKNLGGAASIKRTPEQTAVARFWVVTGAPSWNPILRQFAAEYGLGQIEEARLFALAYLAAADAVIAVFDAKYTYAFWRPITAIRNGDIDGNDQTTLDPAWTPLIDTPPHPEYPCAHCITSAAVGAVLKSQFGSGPVHPFTMTSPTAPGVVRRWDRIDDYVAEVSNARVWGGVHYRNSTEIGRGMGQAIGELAVGHYLIPSN